MKRSSKAPVTGVRKTNNPRSGKGHKAPLSNTKKTKAKHVTLKDVSAKVIQKAWKCYMAKAVFQLLKQTVCAAEYYVTYEILKTVSPLEAELVKDPSMKCKVRFRFSGETFPPFIVFKIFHHTDGHGNQYFSGKNMLQPQSKAAVDVCKVMGRKKFYDQIMEDERFPQKFKIIDKIDIITLKDYMRYSSLMDETPAYSGGRNNFWRRLSLRNFPRTMIMYDIVNYAEYGVMSKRLRKRMKYLVQRPKTEEMRQDQLRIVSEVRYSSLSKSQPLCQPHQQQSQIKHLSGQFKQAQMKVGKMKKTDKMAKEINASVGSEPQTDAPGKKQQQMTVFSSPSFDIVKIKDLKLDDKMEKDKKRSFVWCQDSYTHHFPSC